MRTGRRKDGRVEQRLLNGNSIGARGTGPSRDLSGSMFSGVTHQQSRMPNQVRQIPSGGGQRGAGGRVEQRPLNQRNPVVFLQEPVRVPQRPLNGNPVVASAASGRAPQRPLNGNPVVASAASGRVPQRPLNGNFVPPVNNQGWFRRRTSRFYTNTFHRFLTPPRIITYQYWFPNTYTVKTTLGNPVNVVGQNGIGSANQHNSTDGVAARIALVASVIFVATGLVLDSPALLYGGLFLGCISLLSIALEGEQQEFVT